MSGIKYADFGTVLVKCSITVILYEIVMKVWPGNADDIIPSAGRSVLDQSLFVLTEPHERKRALK